MIRSDLVEAMTEELGDRQIANAVVGCFLETIIAQLEAGGRVELRGFGSFSLRSLAPRVGVNPRSGERIDLPTRRRVYFKAGKPLAKFLMTRGSAR